MNVNKNYCSDLSHNMRIINQLTLKILLIVFFVMSVYCFFPKSKSEKPSFHSSQLQKVTVKNNLTERTDYYNVDGEITIAADLGYATSIITEKDNGTIENYYDDRDEPVSRKLGYYAVFRKYDDCGNNICTTYLDAEENPIVIGNGYAIEERKYNEKGQASTVLFYDEKGLPVPIMSTAYGKINEYDENGNVCRIIYVDIEGVPVMTEQGYAIITHNYYAADEPEKGKKEKEFYFDAFGDPVSLSLGEYGAYKEYDEYGRMIVLTYLDAMGEKATTKKGFTTIVRSYHADNSIATEQYYDVEGNPFSLSEGQYGIKKDENGTVYLDQKGNEYFNFRNLLYNHSWIIIFAVLMTVIISGMVEKKGSLLFLLLYICVIAYFTIMFRENDNTKNVGFFQSYGKIFTDKKARDDILMNIWLFIPFGIFMYQTYPRKITLLIPFLLSIIIEGFQYFTGLGFCEFDDVISNGVGGYIGFVTGKLTKDIMQRIKIWKQKYIE